MVMKAGNIIYGNESRKHHLIAEKDIVPAFIGI